jgi:hypothetical protein
LFASGFFTLSRIHGIRHHEPPPDFSAPLPPPAAYRVLPTAMIVPAHTRNPAKHQHTLLQPGGHISGRRGGVETAERRQNAVFYANG